MKMNNKGFTLIELLVTIALMLSILGIAVVSFINLSNRKKQEAWENVKGQIETAAEEYFKSNEYLFEGFSNNATGQISVGKLVEEDYLNKVSDPRTGKAVSYCTIVNVTKNGSTYAIQFVNDSENGSNKEEDCKIGSTISVSDVGGPTLSTKITCDDSGNDIWCKGVDKGVKISANVDDNGNGTIVKTEYQQNRDSIKDSWTGDDIHNGCEVSDYESTNGSSVCFKVTNIKGKSAVACTPYYLDNDLPTGKINIKSSSDKYNSNFVDISGTAEDETSDIYSVTTIGYNDLQWEKDKLSTEKYKLSTEKYMLFDSLSGTNKIVEAELTDNAGNKNTIESNNFTTYKDCSKIVNDGDAIIKEGSCSASCGNGTIDKTITQNKKDSLTGHECTPVVTTDEVSCKAKDCDTTAPECPSISVVGAVKGNYSWWKKGNTVKADNGSDTSFGLRITPNADTDHWSWTTNTSEGFKTWTDNNKGTLIKGLGDGEREYIITVYDSSNNKKECRGKYYIDTIAPTISINNSIAKYASGDSSCGQNSGAKTVYTVTDSTSGISMMRDYYTPNGENSYNDAYGTYRIQNKIITNYGIKAHYSNKKDAGYGGTISNLTYNDIWTHSGTCATGGGIGTGGYYHKEKACDVAGNCRIHVGGPATIN